MSQEHYQREIDAVFDRTPQLLCHESEVAEPGDHIEMTYRNRPVVVSCDEAGTVRALVKTCRHRGALVECKTSAAGQLRSFVCPYHGWSYGVDGKLKGMRFSNAFPSCEGKEVSLAELPLTKRYGIYWVIPEDFAEVQVNQFFEPLDSSLQALPMDDYEVFKSNREVKPGNWKLILETFLEGYHIKCLHRDSIAPFFGDAIAIADELKPHIRAGSARQLLSELSEDELEQQPITELATLTYMVFPNTKILLHPDYISLLTMMPVSPDEFIWNHTLLIPKEQNTKELKEHWEKSFNLIEHGVFQSEDLLMTESMHKGLKTGINSHNLLGKVEFPAQWLHEYLAEYTGVVL